MRKYLNCNPIKAWINLQPDRQNPDIRAVVEENRGLLKKIQLHIPGFRAYRSGDDLRVADALLRKQISETMNSTLQKLQMYRTQLASQGNFEVLTSIASAISALQQLDGEMLHSAQGYSGISPAIRIDDSKLNALYQYDLNFVENASNIGSAAAMDDLVASGNTDGIRQRCMQIQQLIVQARTSWEKRIETVEQIVVSGGASR